MKFKKKLLLILCCGIFSCGTDAETANETVQENESDAPEVRIEELGSEMIENDTADVATIDYYDLGWKLIETDAIGGVKYGMDSAAVVALIGAPDFKNQEEYWGADGGYHSDWHYKRYAFIIGMSRYEEETDNVKRVDRMTLFGLGDFCTNRNICIDASYDEVATAYVNEIEDLDPDHEQLIAGTMYGGIIFDFSNDQLQQIFIGAAAE